LQAISNMQLLPTNQNSAEVFVSPPATYKDPLHAKTLQSILEDLVKIYGWENLGKQINIKCFTTNPSIKSSLTFLRKTEWAKTKVQNLYLYNVRKNRNMK
jgi:uncharacterized protein (DUF2132 family)